MAHTPGPWVYVDGSVIAGDEQEWEPIAQVPNPDNGPIIAAAPGLLNVAKEIARGSETWYVPGDILDRLAFWIQQAELDPALAKESPEERRDS